MHYPVQAPCPLPVAKSFTPHADPKLLVLVSCLASWTWRWWWYSHSGLSLSVNPGGGSSWPIVNGCGGCSLCFVVVVRREGLQCVTSCSSPHPIGMCQIVLLKLSSLTLGWGWALSPFWEYTAVCISLQLISIFDYKIWWGLQGVQLWEEIIFMGERLISALLRWKNPQSLG